MGTVGAVLNDEKTYYNCPRCGQRKWAYGAYAGAQCWDCLPSNPVGGLVDIATHTSDNVIDGATGGLVTGAVSGATGWVLDKTTNGSNGRVSYECPQCGDTVWAYGSYAGDTCKNCMRAGKPARHGTAMLNTQFGTLFEAGLPKRLCSIRSDKEKVLKLRVRKIWISGSNAGTVAAVAASAVTKTLGAESVRHAWAEIETDLGWYMAQFDGSQRLALVRHSTRASVTRSGLLVVSNCTDKNISDAYTYSPSNRTMADVLKFMENYDGSYDLYSNNCQHFAKALYDWI